MLPLAGHWEIIDWMLEVMKNNKKKLFYFMMSICICYQFSTAWCNLVQNFLLFTGNIIWILCIIKCLFWSDVFHIKWADCISVWWMICKLHSNWCNCRILVKPYVNLVINLEFWHMGNMKASILDFLVFSLINLHAAGDSKRLVVTC